MDSNIEIDSINIEDCWLEEIIRETEHYFQAEIQQEQRASWILAAVSVLIALFVGTQSIIVNSLESPKLLISLILAFFSFSGVWAVITIIPLRGTGLRRDCFGGTYRRDREMDVSDLIGARFRPDEDWSQMKYRTRVFYHYRSHYLRARLKEYFAFWSSICFLLGLIGLSIVAAIELL